MKAGNGRSSLMWVMHSGLWIMGHGLWVTVYGSWVMHYGLWAGIRIVYIIMGATLGRHDPTLTSMNKERKQRYLSAALSFISD